MRSNVPLPAVANLEDAARAGRAGLLMQELPFQEPADIPTAAGAYILVIELAAPLTIPFRGRESTLGTGRYLYCGSAKGPGGLRARIARHMRRGKPMRWHIDQLTERAGVRGAWAFPDGDECALAAQLAHLPVPVSGFGSSDCRRCASHLFAWPQGAPLVVPRRRHWR